MFRAKTVVLIPICFKGTFLFILRCFNITSLSRDSLVIPGSDEGITRESPASEVRGE